MEPCLICEAVKTQNRAVLQFYKKKKNQQGSGVRTQMHEQDVLKCLLYHRLSNKLGWVNRINADLIHDVLYKSDV